MKKFNFFNKKRRISVLIVFYLFLSSVSAFAQTPVTGLVLDDKGEPIIGATVSIKGTTVGTITDVDGKYSINAPSDATLQFSYVGMTTIERPATEVGNIKLISDALNVDEVVVVGYGTQKKESLTGSLQTVDSKKLMDITTPSAENMLTGKVSGVQVTQSSGQPGATAQIVIRGKSTVNGSTDPLWVIDGVIVGSGAYDINPSDIASMTVLKDAASTAIYGSMGANGVILITTKKGKTGKPTINVSAKVGITQLNRGNFSLMNGEELYNYYKSFGNQSSITGAWYNENLANKNFDWWKNGTELGIAQDYNISASGGTDKIKGYVSMGYYDESGAVKGYDYSRLNGRMNLDWKITDWITIKPAVSMARRKTVDKQHDIGSMYRNLPWDSPYLDGELVNNDNESGTIPSWVNTNGTNYLYDLQYNYQEGEAYEVMASMDVDIKIMPWLTFSSVNNYKFSSSNFLTYTDPRSNSGLSDNGSISNETSRYGRIYTNQLLKFNKTIAGDHHLGAIAAYEYNEYVGHNTAQVGSNIPPGFIVSDVAGTPKSVKGSKNEWAVQSFLFNATYDYAGRYLAQVSYRRDGASNFGKNAQYGDFWSVSAGWNMHNEAFFEPLKTVVTSSKLRASYGTVGNRPTSSYPQHGLYSLTKGYNEIPGAIISQVRNDDLTWEKTYTFGVGLDLMFIDRISLSFDYYDKNTTDLLYYVPMPAVTGVTGQWNNVGSVNNKGFEFSLNATVIKTKEVEWNINANLGLNRNKVTELYGSKAEMIVGDGSGAAGSASKILRPGLDVDTWYLTEWAGVNVENGKPEWFTTAEDGTRVRTSDYGEASKHQVEAGAYTPKFFGGFGTDISYKGITLSAVFNYSVGGKIYNYQRTEFDSDGAYTDRNQMNLHKGWSRWEKPGDVATHPQALYGNSSNSNKASTRLLEDGSFLRLRNVTISYDIPFKENKYISGARVFFSGENLFVLSNFSGIDPEVPMHGVSVDPYPMARKFLFGVNLTF